MEMNNQTYNYHVPTQNANSRTMLYLALNRFIIKDLTTEVFFGWNFLSLEYKNSRYVIGEIVNVCAHGSVPYATS